LPYGGFVPAGTTQVFTARAENDPGTTGVTWSISPVSGAGTLSNATSTSVTYNAPASAPPSDVAVTITATSVSHPWVSGRTFFSVPASIVSITAGGGIVPAGSTQVVTAAVQYDPGATGVSWSIYPASGVGTLSNATTTAVTYNAPPKAPASDLSVTVTATSLTNTAVSAAASITVPAISVAVAPDSALVPIKSGKAFKATVNYDPAHGGVTWSLTAGASPCSPDCGTVTSLDATTVSYSAPPTVPASPVTLVATSVTDSTKSGTASVHVSDGTVQLNPLSLNFGNRHKLSSTMQHVSLTNVGAAPLTLSIAILGSASVTGRPVFSESNDCGSSVASAASCDIAVTFRPGVGSYHATLVIKDTSPDSPQQVPLSGQGTGHGGNMATVSRVLAAEKLVVAPTPMGPSRVGTRVVDLTDPERDDPFQAAGVKRELLVRFWYPTSVQGDCNPAPYTDQAVWDYFSELLKQPLPVVRTNSCLDAPVRDGAYPVVVFTHGYTGTFTDYTFLFEDLASRGYIVASIDHTHEATAVAFPDGRFVRSRLGSHLNETVHATQIFEAAESVRLGDVRFVVGELTRLNNEARGPFSAHVDPSSIAVAGHSFGALTALQSLQQDPRIRAAVLIDGVVTEEAVHATEKPVLILDAGRVRWDDEKRHLWNKLQGPRYAVNLREAEHMTPTDAVWLASGAVRTGHMSPENTVAAVREYVATFLEAHLLGRPAVPLLTEPSMRYPDAEVSGPPGRPGWQ
jgi:predicted dienelactone hydrolase